MHIAKPPGLFILLLMLLAGCSLESSQAPNTSEAPDPPQFRTNNFYQSAENSIPRLAEASENFANSVVAFIAQPDQDNLRACRETWLLLHYSLMELDFYFYDLLRSEQFGALVFNIHAWPLQPGFIDSLPEYPTSGIISDLTVELSATSLNQQNAATSDEEISLGMHIMELLLWRSLEDFQPVSELLEQQAADGLVLQQLGNNRRRRALQLISDKLREDLLALGSLLAREQQENRDQAVDGPLQTIQQALQSNRDELRLIMSAEQQAHSEFSQSSLLNILSRMRFIRQAHSGNTNLNLTLQSRNQQLAAEFQQALITTVQEIKNLGLDDRDGITRIMTLTTLLDHHIEEAMALLDD
jgi:hypothetical protein